MKNLFARYTNDVIASCAFGIRVNSFEDPDNEFVVAGRKLMNFASLSMIFRFLIMYTVPFLAKKFDIQSVSTSVRKFFSKMVIDAMKERKERAIFRPDMICDKVK